MGAPCLRPETDSARAACYASGPIDATVSLPRIPSSMLIALGSFALALVAVTSLGALAMSRVTTDLELARLTSVRELIEQEYVEPVSADALLRDAIRGMVEGLDDYSRYYTGQDAHTFEQETSGRFGGIGLVMDPAAPELVRVLFPQPGSPAERAGLRPGMRILEVDRVPVTQIPPDELAERVRGREGTSVVLRICAPDGSNTRDVPIERGPIRDRSVRKVRMLDRERGIASLWIGAFTEETVSEFDEAVAQLKAQGMRSLIMDLRLNGGGVLSAAAILANRFLPQGVLYEMRGRRESLSCEADPAQAKLAGTPLVLLVSRESASASEVLAGALRDHGAAAVVGERTFGKGVVQSTRRFEDTGAYIKITTAYYYTPSGRNLGRPREDDPRDTRAGGIAPDVVVPIAPEDRLALHRAYQEIDVPIEYALEVEELRRTSNAKPPTARADRCIDAAAALLRGGAPPDRALRP